MHVDILSQAHALQSQLLGKFILFLDERVPITSDDIRFLVDAASAEPYRLYGFYAAETKVFLMIKFHAAILKTDF